MPFLYDPLRHLKEEYRAYPSLEGGRIVIRFHVWLRQVRQDEVWEIVEKHERLLRLQLENNGASVQKLLAQGKARLKGGSLVLVKDYAAKE